MDIIINNLSNKGKNIIILGDLNIDFLGRSANPQFQTMLNSYGLQAVVDVPTRVGSASKTAIDQIILNNCLWDFNFKVITTGFSDHHAQILQIQLENQCKSKKRQVISKVESRLARSCSDENAQYLKHLLEGETWDQVYSQTSVNEAYNEFITTFQYYYNIAMPKKWTKTLQHENKWVTPGIRVSSRRLRFLNRVINEGNISEESKEYYIRYKKIYNKVIREAKRLTNNKRISSSDNKSKVMWDIIKEELGTRKKEAKNIEITRNGLSIQDPNEIANSFNNYYVNIAENILSTSPVSNTTVDSINTTKYNSNSMFLTPTMETEVTDIIKGLNNKKSTGIDDISEYVIKKCHSKIITVLTHIINLSLSTGNFPDQLKITKVKPLYKKGLDTDIGNYRPISLISVFSKIMEKVMYGRLLSFLKKTITLSTKTSMALAEGNQRILQ
jgi:hypothetical protein